MKSAYSKQNSGLRTATWLLAVAGALVGTGCGAKVVGATPEPPGPPGGVDGGVTVLNSNAPLFATSVSASDPPPAISGGTLTVLSDGASVAAADPDRDTVSIVDLGDTPTLRLTVQLQFHDEPGRLVQDTAGRVHVVLRRGGALVTIDPQAGTILERRAVCAIPRGVAYDPATDLVHVACMDGQLVSLPAAGGAATRVLQLPRDLRDVVVSGSNLLVSRFRSAQVLTVDPSGNVMSTEVPPDYSDMSARGGARFTPSTAWRMQALPGSGGALLLHQRGTTDPIIIGKNGGHGGVGGQSGSGFGVASGYGSTDPCQAPIHPALTPIGGGQTVPATPPIPGVVLPVDFAVSSDGTQVAVIAAGNAHNSGLTSVFVSSLSQVTDGKFMACCPDGAHGLPGQESDMRCFVSQPTGGVFCPKPSGEPEAVSFDGRGRVIVQTREPATIQIPQDGITVSLSSVSRADVGHAIFHANTGLGIACASCHGEGQDDGRVWDFDTEGPRRTMTVAGGISARAPYHWSGDLQDFSQLFATVYSERMGGAAQPDAFVAATQTWMNGIPALPGLVTDAAAVARGQALFQDNTAHGCALCHTGTQMTNNALANVGTGGTFKVPALVGLAWSGPYMHDGCAATLADRFGACGGGDLHGITSTLTADQQSDLIAYLESL